MEPFKWELINNKQYGWTERGKVFGGWLIRTCAIEHMAISDAKGNKTQISGTQPCMSICFVHDPEHKWEVLLDKDLQ